MAINQRVGFKVGFKSRERVGLAVIILWGFVHLMFYLHDRYSIVIDNYTYLSNVDEHTYWTFIYKHMDAELFYVQHTTMKYFGLFPDWSGNIIWFGYFAILATSIMYAPENKKK